MAITFEQAMTEREFCHNAVCRKNVGPRGGITYGSEVWRRNGETKTWKTRPGQFKIPVKHGLRAYAYITEVEMDQFHIHRGPDCNIG